MKLQYYPDSKILITPAEPVDWIDGEIRDIAEEMFRICAENEGVGLAAPQVGLNKRMFVINYLRSRYVVINPKITWRCRVSDIDREGCLSLPGLYADIKRPMQIRAKFYNQQGGRFSDHMIMGKEARIFQHEYDHLDGVLFPFRLIKKPVMEPFHVDDSVMETLLDLQTVRRG